ncbi:olfactory receptor 11L1-like [Bufo gargarizans]|uniref:olfactory receptor 11L1-like n=1 Tax=Bufo gargarizans TaxID=30331 RepID=UPI001CF2C5BD|nr:olfactory receptor 11L1-like [Bufo gargarizans]
MNEPNHTTVSEIFLLGFKNIHKFKILIFILLLVVYCVTICGNLLIITLVSYSRTLHSPMYFFISQLSMFDILLSTDIVPNTLASIIAEGLVMSFSGCITQFYIFGCSESLECFILAAMAYDRYLAICNPLRYTTIMNFSLFLKMILISWILGAALILVTTLSIFGLEFCGPNVIDHFFCDFASIIQLSCSETSTVEMEVFYMSVFVMILPFFMTVTSYGCIVNTILNLSSNLQRSKAFSTCSSHLIIVCIFYGTLISIYIIPTKGVSLTINKVASLLYTVITPMLNPIIYSLRNKDIKDLIRKLQN